LFFPCKGALDARDFELLAFNLKYEVVRKASYENRRCIEHDASFVLREIARVSIVIALHLLRDELQAAHATYSLLVARPEDTKTGLEQAGDFHSLLAHFGA
jgi:hypothetical protein